MLADNKVTASGLRLAGLVMHRFRTQFGYAEVSIGYAARKLKTPSRIVNRARNVLIERGWLVRTAPSTAPVRPGLSPVARFGLGNGPEDLLLDRHQSSDEAVTKGDVTIGSSG